MNSFRVISFSLYIHGTVFRLNSLPRRVFPMNRGLAGYICTRNIKSPASIYTFTFVRVRHAFFRVPFLSVPFFLCFPTPCSSIHLACFRRSRLIFLLLFRFSLSRAQTFDTVLCPYILYIVICVHTEHRKIPIADLRNASPLYLYKRCINFYNKNRSNEYQYENIE